MVKSVAYKRKVRRAQKLKKILRSRSGINGGEPEATIEGRRLQTLHRDEGLQNEQKAQQKCSSDCSDGANLSLGYEGDVFAKDAHGGMRQAVSLESVKVSSPRPQCHQCDDFEVVRTKYKKQKALLIESMECSKQFQKQLELNEKELQSVQEECKRRICSVRCFWKEMIYKECTRPGIILKKSLQRRSTVGG
jgi:hypothetical protein